MLSQLAPCHRKVFCPTGLALCPSGIVFFPHRKVFIPTKTAFIPTRMEYFPTRTASTHAEHFPLGVGSPGCGDWGPSVLPIYHKTKTLVYKHNHRLD